MTQLEASSKLTARMVSIYDLRRVLLPLMDGIKGAEDDLMDLWKMGAPDPSPASNPCLHGMCEKQIMWGERCGKWGCAREKRVLLPQQFAAWWEGIARQQGLELTAGQALNLGKRKNGRH